MTSGAEYFKIKLVLFLFFLSMFHAIYKEGSVVCYKNDKCACEFEVWKMISGESVACGEWTVLKGVNDKCLITLHRSGIHAFDMRSVSFDSNQKDTKSTFLLLVPSSKYTVTCEIFEFAVTLLVFLVVYKVCF